MIWRSIVVLGTLATFASPAAAQQDSGQARPPRYRIQDTTRGSTRSYSITTRSEGWLGIGLSCSHCSLSLTGTGDTRRWSFSELPRVFSVDDDGPGDRAGLRIGDVLVAMDGVSLTTADGGARFGSIRPGQTVRLTYRREGRERTVEMVAGARPVTEPRQLAEMARAMRRAQEEQEHALETSRGQLERSQQTLEEMRAEMESRLAEAQSRRDSTSLTQLAQMRRALEDQQRVLARMLAERSTLEGQGWWVAPPAPPDRPEAPEPAEAAEQPEMPAPASPPAPPTAYREHRGFGPLRYTGRLGDVVIEARGPGGVTATEVSDSEVVITSGDLSVRLALLPRAAPRAAEPAPAPTPRPPQN